MLLLDSAALHHCSVEPKPGLCFVGIIPSQAYGFIGIILMCFSFVKAAGALRAAARTGVTTCML